ncbi:helicase-exonuclease AddAB subunit AddA [Liquorilactobacillus vini]|uniref:ATP-dependent helicase/nuclease subunit A n=2 Tax=Liquorilactobacillus vini TaxID=238015 RepID=A0A0R2CLQ4_9LACO|nr:helicase-exonuclease AddAB subunit AddA [Liquorilactobacillus vini]KRM89371.1 ATP-dependent nuclease subunit A [Liquorilactobacillus vini DSM 20605]
MSEKINYTPQQQAAIQTSGKNILVAASAGSGKTKVLVERVLNLLQQQVGIDRLLVVTFTKAAAAEMKERIEQALQAELAQLNSKDVQRKQWLLQQRLKLKTADISTIDAFCLHLVQQYYYVIHLDPVFRQLTDETERQLLAEDVWAQVREKRYGQQRPAFEQLTQNFSNDRSDDGLSAVVMKVFEYANAQPQPIAWVKKLPAAYAWPQTGGFQQSSFYQKQLAPLLQAKLTTIERQLGVLEQQATENGLKKFAAAVTTDQQQVTELKQQLQTVSWDTLQAAVWDFKPARSAAQKLTDEQKLVKKQLTTQRQALKKEFEKLRTGFFSQNETQLQQVAHQAQQLVAELSQTVLDFMTAFRQAKQQRQLLDFSDIEHLAYQILTTRTPIGQQVRTDLQQHYQAIMIDEYQDTNQLQEAILQAIAQTQPGNLFMVGDAKQSIYGFRQADPTMFLEKFHSYQRTPALGQLITLPDNFRSSKTIDEFNNLIFSQLMDERIGGINYYQTAQLKYGAKYYDDLPTDPVEILLYTDQTQATSAQASSAMEPYQSDFSAESLTQGEIQLIGKRILKLKQQPLQIKTVVAGKTIVRPIEYQDIALLVPTRNNNLMILDEFQRLGIPVMIKDAQNYFQTIEIQIMVSFLQIIDNPYQDIPLVSVLRSPIVGLKENELAYLRINDRTDDYYTSVLHFWKNFDPAQANDFSQRLYQKIDWFIQLLQDLRTFARRNELAALIWRIYDKTGFLDYVGGMPGGTQRQANLHALYQRASVYEKMSYRGLFQFIRFILRMQQQQHDLAAAPAQATLDAVQVMTIHGSKGLEFPVVFLINATHQINQQDLRRSYQLNQIGGIGITWLNPKTRVKVPTLPKLLFDDQAQIKLAAEQMRLLYVALTRAKQKLIITGAYADPQLAISTWTAAQASSQLLLPTNIRQKTSSLMDWIGASLIRHPDFKALASDNQPLIRQLPQLTGFETSFLLKWITPDQLAIEPKQQPSQSLSHISSADQQQLNAIKQQLSYVYPDWQLTQTTAYQSVSEIKRLFNDPDEKELDFMEVDRPTPPARARRLVSNDLRLPQFMTTAKQPVATQIGTAVHLVLQKISLSQSPTQESLEALIQQLTNQGLIESSIAGQIDRQRILNFFASSLGRQLLAHPQQVEREIPFSLLLPVAKKSADILVHGIIDGFLSTVDQVLLFDYKTDFVLPHDQTKQQQICERYRGQLNLYSQALEKILQRPVNHKYLYLLAADQLVEL